MPRSGIARSDGFSILLIEDLPNCFPQWLYHFTCSPAVRWVPVLQILIDIFIFHFFDYSPPSGCGAVSYCGFYLYVPRD